MSFMIVFVFSNLKVFLKNLGVILKKCVCSSSMEILIPKIRIKTLFNASYVVIKFLDGKLIANFAIELLMSMVVLVNFGTILTTNTYSKSVKEFKRN